MMAMIPRLKLYAIGAAVLLAIGLALAAAWRWHLIDIERNRAAAEAARDFRNTIERIGNADTGTGNPDDDLRWLDQRLRDRQGGAR